MTEWILTNQIPAFLFDVFYEVDFESRLWYVISRHDYYVTTAAHLIFYNICKNHLIHCHGGPVVRVQDPL